MANTESMQIEVPSTIAESLQSAINSGEYSDTQEIVIEALETWKLQWDIQTLDMDKVRTLVKEGEQSGEGLDRREVFMDLKEKYAAGFSFTRTIR